jgi:DNA-directed RNA polymerase specialized sigma24 family protein
VRVPLDDLYRKLRPALVKRVSALLGGDESAAEDVVQEAFTLRETLTKVAQMTDADEARRYLWSRAIGRGMVRLRTERRRTRYEAGAAAAWRASRGLGSAARMAMRLDACRVYLEGLVDEASPDDAEVVLLMTFAGMTQSEAKAARPHDDRSPQRLGQVNREVLARLARRFPELSETEFGPEDDHE